MNCANEPSQAALEWSSQDAYDIVRLTRSNAAVWTVDDVARLIDFFKNNSYLFFYPWQHMVLRDDRIIPITKLYSTVFIYVLYEYSKRFVQSVVKVQTDNTGAGDRC